MGDEPEEMQGVLVVGLLLQHLAVLALGCVQLARLMGTEAVLQ